MSVHALLQSNHTPCAYLAISKNHKNYRLLVKRRNRFRNFRSNVKPDRSNSFFMRHSEADVCRSILSSKSFSSTFQAGILATALPCTSMNPLKNKSMESNQIKRIKLNFIELWPKKNTKKCWWHQHKREKKSSHTFSNTTHTFFKVNYNLLTFKCFLQISRRYYQFNSMKIMFSILCGMMYANLLRNKFLLRSITMTSLRLVHGFSIDPICKCEMSIMLTSSNAFVLMPRQ